MMKPKATHISIFVVIFLAGMALGTLSEKIYGFKNIGKIIGVSHWIGAPTQINGISESIVAQEHQGKLQLFILAGQSNMSGMGDMPLSGMDVNPRVYVFGNDYHWKLAREPIDDSKNQVDTVSEDKSAGFSPALSFATTLLKQSPDMLIGLIPCAKGGSLIDEWQRNLSDKALYGSCLKRVRAASVMGNVVGLLYFQGEIDAIDPKEHPRRIFSSHQWADKFSALVRDWRRDLNSPELPIVFAQIGTNTEPDRFKNWAVVKAQQRMVQIPFSRMIATDDLALKDYVHFTTESYRIIGQRFAKSYFGLRLEMNKRSHFLGS
jgi:Carbohydrate esterase, sialic acid-specific acetylesterase